MDLRFNHKQTQMGTPAVLRTIPPDTSPNRRHICLNNRKRAKVRIPLGASAQPKKP